MQMVSRKVNKPGGSYGALGGATSLRVTAEEREENQMNLVSIETLFHFRENSNQSNGRFMLFKRYGRILAIPVESLQRLSGAIRTLNVTFK